MARPSIIRKSAADLKVAPHWTDYKAGRAGFSWEQVRRAARYLTSRRHLPPNTGMSDGHYGALFLAEVRD